MRTLELRRHSIRDRNSAHLSQAGVTLARAQGATLPPFALVLSSPALRAIETAVALGHAIDEERDELALPDEPALALELDACKKFADVARLIKGGLHMPAYARQLLMFADTVAGSLEAGAHALLVTHGGVVETLALACDTSADAAALGTGISFCEGVTLQLNDGTWSIAAVTRLKSNRT